MQSFEFTPQGVCARKITFDLEDGLIHHLHFEGGCPGNLAAIGKLLEGRSAKEAADILPAGFKCPHCGSANLSVISRVCGYLGYSNVNGMSRMNDGKMAEIRNRKSM